MEGELPALFSEIPFDHNHPAFYKKLGWNKVIERVLIRRACFILREFNYPITSLLRERRDALFLGLSGDSEVGGYQFHGGETNGFFLYSFFSRLVTSRLEYGMNSLDFSSLPLHEGGEEVDVARGHLQITVNVE